LIWLGLPAAAETLRLATYNADLTRAGPGLLYGDILSGDDAQIAAVIRVIDVLDADILLLTGVDFDHDLIALGALNAGLSNPYPHLFARQPNTGLQTGLDLDQNGKSGEPRDAQGWGRFSGEGGMAILSRLPVEEPGVRDFTDMLWQDLPGALLPDQMPQPIRDIQRLSTTGHWLVPVRTANGRILTVMAWAATPPVFDGPEDLNGRRNHDEAAFWHLLIDGKLSAPPPMPPFVLMGDANLDPADGDGLRDGIAGLIAHPMLRDPLPKGTHGRSEPDHSGDPALDTALYDPGVGGLRVDLVVPSADLSVTASGVLWPDAADPLAAGLATASRHRPVWVDIALP
jgi:Endonuclease/Exonuclease/phosphatase family